MVFYACTLTWQNVQVLFIGEFAMFQFTMRIACGNFVSLLGAVFLSIAGFSAATVGLEPELPDIVYVIGDDQAWGDYGFMGHPHIETPNLDRLASQSLLFTRGYVPDSLCRPSLATMISGLYPHQHGIVGNDPPPRSGARGNRAGLYRNVEYQKTIEEYLKLHIDKVETLPDRLKKLGYRSFQSGKWWEGNYSRGGFDQGMTHGDHNRGARHGDVGLEIGRSAMQPVADFISSAHESQQPYFLWYAPMLPHTPHDPPADLLAKYKPLAPTESIAKYWAMCERFDKSVGDLLEIIHARGRPDDTLIVFACDNGWINLPDKSAYAPRSKRSQYDGGTRTPIMFHWPKKILARRDDTHLATTIDLVPTVLQQVGLPQDVALPGIDLNNQEAVSARGTIFGEILEHDIEEMDNPRSSLMYRWVIDGHMKLIVAAKDGIGKEMELFDLSKDPHELLDLADQRRDIVDGLRAKLDSWWK
jgi:arylsulfatase A-like enzyme